METHHTKLDKKGAVVIPAKFREELRMQTGDKLVIKIESGEIRLHNTVKILDHLERMFKKTSRSVNRFLNKLEKAQ